MAQKMKLGKGLPPVPESYVDPAPTSTEIDQLVATWNSNVPAEYRDLLEAPSLTKLSLTGEKYNGRWVWDDKNKKYIDRKTGKPMSRAEMHAVFSSFVRSYTRRRGRNA